MRIGKAIIQKRMERFVQECRNRSVKLTHQRLEIYRELASTGEHPDANMIYQRIRKRIPTISLDTVYRNLRLLENHDLIRIVGMSHERLRFDANLEHHHHFSCTHCARIFDFRSENESAPILPAEAYAYGAPLSLHLEVRGVCTECGRKSPVVETVG